MGSITDSCVVGTFSAGFYTGRTTDKKAAELVAETNHVEVDTGRYWKRAMKNSHLEEIKSLVGAARAEFYRFSTEWREGLRIMPTLVYYQKWAPLYRDYEAKFKSLVDDFCAEYGRYVQQERTRLGAMFNEADYPLTSNIRDKFRMEFHILPVPTAGDFRIDLIQEEMDQVRKTLTDQMQQAQRTAMRQLYDRLQERVTKMHATFSVPDKKFWDSMLTHTQELCADLKLMNFTNDPDLEALRLEVETNLANLDINALRVATDPDGYRADAAKKARDIAAKIERMKGNI